MVAAAAAGELRQADAVPRPAGTLQLEKQGNGLAAPIPASGRLSADECGLELQVGLRRTRAPATTDLRSTQR
jgi:hypothetical protein